MKTPATKYPVKVILFVSLLASPFFLCAQKIEVSLQPVIEFKESASPDDMIRTDDGYFSINTNLGRKTYGLSTTFSKIVYKIELKKYDLSMNEVKVNDIENAATRFGPLPPVIKKIDNNIYVVYYEFSPNEETMNIKVSLIDRNTLEMSAPKEMFKTHMRDLGVFKGQNISKSILRLERSPDKTKNLLFWQSGLDNNFVFSVFDKDLNVSLTKNELIDIPEDIMVTSACVDNAGNVCTGYKVEGRKTGIKGHVLISPQTGKEKDILISQEDQIYQVLAIPSKNGNMIHIAGNCFGNTDYISAVFSASLSIDKQELSNYKRTDFDEKFIESFAQNGLAFTKKNKYGLYPFDMDAFELEDGTVDVVGGLSKSKDKDMMNANHGAIDVLFTSGSMLNAHFKKDNVVLSRIPRNRENYETTGDGYYALPYKNSMIFFYNDHESNLKNSLTEMPTSSDNYKNSVLVAATVSGDGDIKREIIIDLKDDNFITLPVSGATLSPGSVLFPIRKIVGQMKISDKFRWGLITVN